MTWNHRVVRKFNERDDQPIFEIHEVHYDDSGQIVMWTAEPITPFGYQDLSDLHWTLERMLEACSAPVLDWEALQSALPADPPSDPSETC